MNLYNPHKVGPEPIVINGVKRGDPINEWVALGVISPLYMEFFHPTYNW